MRLTTLRMFIALVAVAAVMSVAGATATGTTAIKERQEAMEDIGQAITALAAIAKKEAPFDAGVVEKNAGIIAEALTKSADLFPEGSDKGDPETWAKAEIWTDRENFNKDLQTAHAAAVEMQSVTDEAAFGAALGALGNGCKTCHDKYRRPKQ